MSLRWLTVISVLAVGNSANVTFWDTMVECLPTVVKNSNAQVVFLEEELKIFNATEKFLRMPLDRSVVDVEHSSRVVGTFVLFPGSLAVDYNKLTEAQTRAGSKYILLVHSIGKLFSLFDVWVQKRLLDVAALAPSRYGGVNVYTFDPFKPGRCWDAEPQRVDLCRPGGTLALGVDPFSKRNKTSDLHGCRIEIAAMVKQPELYFDTWGTPHGLLERLYSELAETLNYKPVPFVIRHEASATSVSDIVRTIAKGIFDFGFGRFSHLVDGEVGISFSRQTGVDCFTWGVPSHAGTKPSDLAPFLFEFPREMWGYILLAAISVPIAFKILVVLSPVGENAFRSNGFLALFTYATAFGISLKAEPHSDSLRLFVSHWLLYCLVVASAYQASMGSLITVPSEVGDIESTGALLASDLRLKGGSKMFAVLNESADTSEVIRKSLDRFEIIVSEEFRQIVYRAYTNKNMAVFSTSRDLAYAYLVTRMDTFESMHIIKECLVKSATSPAIFRKGAPLEDSINRAVSGFLESGILNFWEKDIKELPTERNSTNMAMHKQFTKKQMKAPILFLLVGHLLAFFTLFSELCIAKVYKKKINRKKVFSSTFAIPPPSTFLL
ncbi:hypothetical protein AAG570_013502 [Ranatra chinensis]|uniref:Ionotropic glutamate receptor C-terminal domain-containing protein n=1 Tax=Ranatra chinensis TaxID=642074 RepID=A0ABD0YUV7_9HEMI